MNRACRFLILFLAIAGVAFGANDDEVEYLRSQYAALQKLPLARQQQLRKLDRDLAALDADAQERLFKVAERYNYWLAHLPPDDRKRVLEATAEERLSLIEKLKDREWVETLPKAQRDKYAATEKDIDRRRLVDLWREEQRERRDEWQFTLRNWADIRDDRLPAMFQLDEFRRQLDAYAANLETQLNPIDRDRLKRARGMEDRWPQYPRTLAELSERYPLLPGPLDGPRTFEALPAADREAFEKADRAFAKKKTLPKELIAAQGRWPDFALAATEYARQRQFSLPEPLGPTNKEAMPADVRAFIVEKLEPALRKSPADVAKLKEAEGKWPDYPRAVMELSRQAKLVVPGWMLPGRSDVWERFKTKPKK